MPGGQGVLQFGCMCNGGMKVLYSTLSRLLLASLFFMGRGKTSMQTNILWTGREYYSLENCLIRNGETGWEITSTIIGSYQDKIYRVEYHIRTNADWQTVSVVIKSRHSDQVQDVSFQSDARGNWSSNGKELPEFKGCMDVDIPLTPFTNTLPINRMKLEKHEEREIRVMYIDLLENRITPVTQRYRHLSDGKYHYENVPNDFEADIEVDEAGYVVDYPELFVRSALLETKYE